MPLAPRDRIDFHGRDDVREGQDEGGGVFVVVLVEGEVFGAEDDPEPFPLADAAFGFQAEEVAVPDHALVVVVGVEAGGLAGVASGAGGLVGGGVGGLVARKGAFFAADEGAEPRGWLVVALGWGSVLGEIRVVAQFVTGIFKLVRGGATDSWDSNAVAGGGGVSWCAVEGLGRAGGKPVGGIPSIVRRGFGGPVVCGGTIKVHFLLFLVDARFLLDELHPCAGVGVAFGLEVEIPRGREKTKDMLSAAFGIFEVGDCRQVGEGHLFEQALFRGGFVEREEIGAEHEVEGFPLLLRGDQSSLS